MSPLVFWMRIWTAIVAMTVYANIYSLFPLESVASLLVHLLLTWYALLAIQLIAPRRP